MIPTVVIIHPGALGDVLLAVPAISRLRNRFYRHQLILCANEPVSRFLLDCEVIDAWVSVEGTACAELFAGAVPVSSDLNRWLERCDLGVAWVRDPAGTLAAALRHGGAKEVLIRTPFSSEVKTGHQSDRFLEAIGEPAIDVSADRHIPIPRRFVEEGKACFDRIGIPAERPVAVVHVGSGARHKCVSPERLAIAIEQLKHDGVCPLLLEGPADKDSVASLLKLISCDVPVVRGPDLTLLAGMLVRSQLYLGHDSGITHLSSLLGVRTIALFGPTDPGRWAPRGCHVTVLRGEPCRCPSWDAVKDCAEKPCLSVPVQEIVRACRESGLDATTPRNSSRYALSPPTPCAKVAR
jgi:ADP-heptose:LPS heptosyltransferase